MVRVWLKLHTVLHDETTNGIAHEQSTEIFQVFPPDLRMFKGSVHMYSTVLVETQRSDQLYQLSEDYREEMHVPLYNRHRLMSVHNECRQTMMEDSGNSSSGEATFSPNQPYL